MKQLFRTLPVLIFVFFALVNTGCKENTIINSRVSPSTNSVGVFDTTLSVITHTYYSDTVATSIHFSGISIYQGLGAFEDPFFGTMVSSVYFNVVPADYSNLTDSLVDSAILIMPYSGLTYGDSANQSLTQTYQVFYMNDTMDYNSTYYSFTNKPIDVIHPLSDPTTVNLHSLKDSFDINVLAQNTAAMHIKLNLRALLNKLEPALVTTNNGSGNASAFLNAFNGICVQVADTRLTNRAIPYFRLDGSGTYTQASIIVYYHQPGTQTSVGVSYYYDIASCSHFNAITKSYSRYPVNNLLNSTQPNDQVIALQSKPGATLDVVVPGLSKLPAGVINKAELRLTVLPGYSNNFPSTSGDSISFLPYRLTATGVANSTYPVGIGNGLLYNIADNYPLYSTSPFLILDGSSHAGYPTAGLQTFTIGIPREVMASIMAKNDTLHLHVDGTLDFYGAFHLVAGGGNYPDPQYQAKLFVVYSKLSN